MIIAIKELINRKEPCFPRKLVTNSLDQESPRTRYHERFVLSSHIGIRSSDLHAHSTDTIRFSLFICYLELPTNGHSEKILFRKQQL